MSKIALLLLFTINSHFVSELLSINELRILYKKAATNESYCKELISRLASCNKEDHPLYFGYKGGATMMMAQYAYSPFTKLSYFKKGKKMLETAIAADKNNIELRFLRLAIQMKTPSFLDYKNNIEADKSFLVNSVSALTDQSLKKNIINYLKNNGYSNTIPANHN